ncbi:MAG: MMPL family transporter [Myxococcales bacterium]|nr:MMPL family transporter [Myxococcales bacterium]
MSTPLHARAGAWWAGVVLARRRLTLALALLLTIVGVWLSAQLEIDSEMRNLLPADNEVVASAREVEARFGPLGAVDVLVAGGTPEARRAFADAVARALADHPLLESVDVRLDSSFFLERALYYLSDEDVARLGELVDAWEHHALCSRAPEVCLTPGDPEAGARLAEFLEGKRAEAGDRARFSEYYEREGIDALALFLHPREPASDLRFVLELSAELEDALARLRASPGPWSGTDLRVNAVGSYTVKAHEYAIVQRDMLRCGLLGAAAVLLVILLALRSARALLILLLPLVAGVSWALGLAELVVGHLNAITSLIASVIMGMGVDAGVHLLTRARQERRSADPEQAVTRALAELLGPMLVATSTTAGGFLVMASSRMPAFYELGIVGALGVLTCALATLTLLPVLLVIFDPGPSPARGPDRARWSRAALARPGRALALLGLVTVIAGLGAAEVWRAGLVRNARELQSAASRARFEADSETIQRIFGRAVRPGVIVVDDYATLARALARADALHAERVARGESVVESLMAAPRLMPPPERDMRRRREAIDALAERFSERTLSRLEERAANEVAGEDAARLGVEDARLLRRMLEARPFGPDDLPPAVRARLQGDDGSWAMFAYPNFDPGDIVTGLDFLAETRDYAARPGQVYVGEPTVFAAMWAELRAEAPLRLALALALVTILVWLQVRRLGLTLITISPLLVGLIWMLGAMGLLGVRFSLYNVAILPAVIGVSVDNGVYVAAALGSAAPGSGARASALASSGRAVAIAALTTGGGFASFLSADYVGLRGIGHVAVLGIGAAALTATLLVPALLAVATRRA